MSELGKRVAVAAVGIPTVLLLVYLGGWFLSVPLAAFAAWGTHELSRMAVHVDIRPVEWIAAPAASILVLLASWKASFGSFAPHALAIVGVSTVGAVVVAIWRRGPSGAPLASAAVTAFAAIYLGLALAFAPLLHALPRVAAWPAASGSVAGLMAVALPLAVTWVGDASAYFAGTAWGKAKLAPSISPNKSWVGFWAAVGGGALAAVAWLLVARVVAGTPAPSGPSETGAVTAVTGGGLGGLLVMAAVGAVIGVAAVVGDLVESLLKREAGVKDSGTFFPGHGGVLDRIDSLLFTIPAAYLALALLGAVTP
jgi:phosphatidate cytidylyltransferase